MPRTARTVCVALLLAASASAAVVTLSKPVAAEVYVKTAGKATPLRGSLVRYDDTTFTLHAGSDVKLAWTDVTPATAFALRQKTVDRTKADQMLVLGKFGWDLGAKEQAQAALRTAVKLDPALKAEVDLTLASPAGAAALAAVATSQPTTGHELLKEGPAPAATKSPAAKDDAPEGGTVKYVPATPEQAADAMARSRKQSAGVQKTIGVKLEEFETDHFLVFTDWNAGDYDFLKRNLEDAYKVVAKQFEMDPKDNVFVGKLPVYMLSRYSDFANFARKVDQFPDVNNRTAGYYMGNTRGFGHMAMWQPNESLVGTPSIDDARRLWAYVLVHEFTHAFLARYKSNVFIPRWLNEGIAEVIANGQFPYANRRRMARMIAMNSADLSFLFDDANRPTGEYYPVMQSMAELLVSTNKQSFLKLIDAIKDGTSAETAMQTIYHADYEQFAAKWREWARNRKDD